MKKYILLLSVLFFCSSTSAAELEAMKIDAAKRASCSKKDPCSINIKGHNGTYVVKVNSVTITKNGVININHYKFRRFVYIANGTFSHENNGK